MPIELTLFAALAALTVGPYWIWHSRRERRHRAAYHQAQAAGHEPATLHPVIDPLKCIGTAACTLVCPEGDVLGVIEGHAVLSNPTHCIGHGACLTACPVDAISLAFGTAKRGVEIPHVSASFETNVPGVFIAGELGGMGLIRNAMTQGVQAAEAIAGQLADERKRGAAASRDVLDLLIVGAGPAGLAAGLTARQAGLRFEIVDQEEVGGFVFHYPRKKLVMTAPVELPIFGTVKAREISKESLLELWHEIIDSADLTIRTRERVDAIGKQDGTFTVRTTEHSYRARRVLLAIGRRGSPRKLEVPGEEASHVAYSLGDPTDFQGDRVLVVGGGNSALEAAAALADPALGNDVALSYRGDVFTRAAEKNRARVDALAREGHLELLLKSTVRAIHDDNVVLDVEGHSRRLPTERVFVFAGGVLPTAFLRQLGVAVEVKFGTR